MSKTEVSMPESLKEFRARRSFKRLCLAASLPSAPNGIIRCRSNKDAHELCALLQVQLLIETEDLDSKMRQAYTNNGGAMIFKEDYCNHLRAYALVPPTRTYGLAYTLDGRVVLRQIKRKLTKLSPADLRRI